MKKYLIFSVILFAVLSIAGCNGSGGKSNDSITVNSLEDPASPPEGTVTLRSALASADDGQPIVFDESLDGGVIELSIIGEEHTILHNGQSHQRTFHVWRW